MKFYTVKFLSLPKILFAIEVHAGKYCNYFIDRKDFLEISCHLSGEATFRHKNGKEEEIMAGEMLAILPDFNGISYSETGNNHITVGMEVKYDYALYDTDEMSKEDIRSCLSFACEEDAFLLPYRHTPSEKFPFFYNDVTEISRYFLKRTVADLGFCKARLFRLFSKISSVCANELLSVIESGNTDINRNYCELVKTYIEKHCCDKIRLDAISKEIGITKNHLCRIFKATEQCTVNEYITNYRLELCKTMLTASGVPISQISEKIGVPDEYYLSRLFKKKYGISIKQYRNITTQKSE